LIVGLLVARTALPVQAVILRPVPIFAAIRRHRFAADMRIIQCQPLLTPRTGTADHPAATGT
jgi:hypothetical protein